MFTACISFPFLVLIVPCCLYLPPCSEEAQMPAGKTGKFCPWTEEQKKDYCNKPNCDMLGFYGEDIPVCAQNGPFSVLI